MLKGGTRTTISATKVLLFLDICKYLGKIVQKRWLGCHLLEYFLGFDFVVAMPANKIEMLIINP